MAFVKMDRFMSTFYQLRIIQANPLFVLALRSMGVSTVSISNEHYIWKILNIVLPAIRELQTNLIHEMEETRSMLSNESLIAMLSES